jgi:hypothetical protein
MSQIAAQHIGCVFPSINIGGVLRHVGGSVQLIPRAASGFSPINYAVRLRVRRRRSACRLSDMRQLAASVPMNAPAEAATRDSMGFGLSATIHATTAPAKLRPVIFEMREVFIINSIELLLSFGNRRKPPRKRLRC